MRIIKSATHLLLTVSAFAIILSFPKAAVAQTKADISSDAAVIASGQKIFENNCAQCHAIHEEVVGPKLAGVYDRQKVQWLITFIKGPQAVIESGDKHAVSLYKKYKQYMPNHDFLSDAEIMSILSYVKEMTVNPPVVDKGPVVNGGDPAQAKQDPLVKVLVVGLIVLLVIVVGVLGLLVSVLVTHLNKSDKEISEDDQEFIDQKFDVGAFFRSGGFVGTATFVLIAILLKALLDGLFTVGVQQGYAPDQPIPFSHKLHAGYYEIDCKYCHTGVEKSKNANIPSPNICMNCHNTIRTTAPNIQKIYAAIESNKPIEWVRVHNLPDLAYFNHSQHVKVGGLDCVECHGDVKNMEVVQQHSLLTMGWCVDCHRKTEVNSGGNAYYDRLMKAHKEMNMSKVVEDRDGDGKRDVKDQSTPMYVEDLGGLECSKCHY